MATHPGVSSRRQSNQRYDCILQRRYNGKGVQVFATMSPSVLPPYNKLMSPDPRKPPKEGGGTLTKPRAKGKLKPPALWQVLLHNDDFTTQEFVVWVLRSVFHKPDAEAVRIMLNVHQQGKGLAGIYTRDVAETRLAQVRRLAEAQEFPLMCTMEPET